jgi:hypothetical protein
MANMQPTAHPFTRVLAFSVLIGACLVLILCLAGIIGEHTGHRGHLRHRQAADLCPGICPGRNG